MRRPIDSTCEHFPTGLWNIGELMDFERCHMKATQTIGFLLRLPTVRNQTMLLVITLVPIFNPQQHMCRKLDSNPGPTRV
jgi:hypothetical protein